MISEKARSDSGVKIILRFWSFVMITWYQKNRCDNCPLIPTDEESIFDYKIAIYEMVSEWYVAHRFIVLKQSHKVLYGMLIIPAQPCWKSWSSRRLFAFPQKTVEFEYNQFQRLMNPRQYAKTSQLKAQRDSCPHWSCLWLIGSVFSVSVLSGKDLSLWSNRKENLAVHKRVLDVTAIEGKASENFHDIPFSFKRYEISKSLILFAMGWIPSGDKKWPTNLIFYRKRECFIRSCLETSFWKKGMVFVD